MLHSNDNYSNKNCISNYEFFFFFFQFDKPFFQNMNLIRKIKHHELIGSDHQIWWSVPGNEKWSENIFYLFNAYYVITLLELKKIGSHCVKTKDMSYIGIRFLTVGIVHTITALWWSASSTTASISTTTSMAQLSSVLWKKGSFTQWWRSEVSFQATLITVLRTLEKHDASPTFHKG